MTTINRRWFRFSLRTLFVVVTVAPWLGWNLYQIHAREQMLQAGGVGYYAGFGSFRYMPLRWRLLGARSVYSIASNHFSDQDLARYKAAFPEAYISGEWPPLSPPIPSDAQSGPVPFSPHWLTGCATLNQKSRE
jgi:hypothetical protein